MVELEDLAELQQQRIAEAKKKILEHVDFTLSELEQETRKKEAIPPDFQTE